MRRNRFDRVERPMPRMSASSEGMMSPVFSSTL